MDRPKTSLKWEEKALKELIIVICKFQMTHTQSNARLVSREIKKATLALLGRPLLGLHLYVE